MKRSIPKLWAFALFSTAVLTAQAQSSSQPDYWGLCATPTLAPPQPEAEVGLEPGSVSIDADRADLIEGGVSHFEGDVVVIRDQSAIQSDSLDYDSQSERITAAGEVDFWSESLYWGGERMQFDLNAQTAVLERGRYALTQGRGRGEAALAEIDDQQHFNHFEQVYYTTCEGENPVWKFAASELEMDNNNDVGVARNITLRIKNIPILYLPYASFPLTDHRKTGFLFPYFGSSNDAGIDFNIPFYWNIAPNFDATLTPRYIEERGAMLRSEFRYLQPRYHGRFDLEYLPGDDKFSGDDRSLFGLYHHYDNGRTYARIDYKNVSDKEYFEDFGRSLSVSSTRYLEQQATVRHVGDFWTVSGRLQNYQLVDRTILSRPYKRLPEVNFRLNLPAPNRALNFHFASQAVYFDIDQNPLSPTPNLTGGRINLMPAVSYPYVTASGFIKPKLTLQHTHYLLDNTGNQLDTNESRTLPIFSVDSGLFFERNVNWFSGNYLQTLEPRVFYLYIPEQDQSQLPIFDTGEYEISFAQLFREGRFSGHDRVGDANQITLALSSRLIDNRSGVETLRASIGQIYYLEEREVFLPTESPNDDNQSELIAEVAGRIGKHWSAFANLQWNPNNNVTDKAAFRVRYEPRPGAIVNAAYRLRRGISSIEQTDVSFQWPLNPHWSLVGRWNYSLPEKEHLETVAGFEYNSCCWGARIVGRRYLADSNGTYDNAIFFQFQLKGLAGLGSSTRSYLERSIPGYNPDF